MGCLAIPTLWALCALAGRLADAGFLPPVAGRGDSRCVSYTFDGVLPANAVVEKIEWVPEGGSYGEGLSNILYPMNPTKLPQLCAVTVNVSSSAISNYRFGLFLPTRSGHWEQRFFAIGNGGFGGGESVVAAISFRRRTMI